MATPLTVQQGFIIPWQGYISDGRSIVHRPLAQEHSSVQLRTEFMAWQAWVLPTHHDPIGDRIVAHPVPTAPEIMGTHAAIDFTNNHTNVPALDSSCTGSPNDISTPARSGMRGVGRYMADLL